MKTFKLVLVFIVFIVSCNSVESDKLEKVKKDTSYKKGTAKIEFIKTEFDFGTLQEGEIVECTFFFKNIGSAPLKITSVDADCGCTVPQYSKEPVLPGAEGKIKAVFNSVGFRNNINKTIDVETNADSTITELLISAFIESKFKLND